MVTMVSTAAILGVEAKIVTVEVDISDGLPQMEMVGKLSQEVREAAKRVRVALKNIGIRIPPKRITINLSPASLPKEGTAYDLPVAVALLEGLGFIPEEEMEGTLVAGEIGLNGEIRPVRGILPMALKAEEEGFRSIILSMENRPEAEVVERIRPLAFDNLSDMVEYFQTPEGLRHKESGEGKSTEGLRVNENRKMQTPEDHDPEIEVKETGAGQTADFADLYGQEGVKRVMEIAAAGFHNLLMIGPPGSGKSMAARRLPTILPELTREECLDVSKIYSVSGLLGPGQVLVKERPFVAPHHSATLQAMAGGGRTPSPGLISRAHKGVLFLDEVVHFPSGVLEVLRQPMEDKKILVSRSQATYEFPAEFMLVVALNPCPCGYYPDTERCRCTEEAVRRYLGKLSGPLLDRIDLCMELSRLPSDFLKRKERGDYRGMDSATMREHVLQARSRQKERFGHSGLQFNAQMGVKELEKYVVLDPGCRSFMEEIYEKSGMSLRSYHRILRVARTIADLEGAEDIGKKHLMEALCYRGIEERYWK